MKDLEEKEQVQAVRDCIARSLVTHHDAGVASVTIYRDPTRLVAQSALPGVEDLLITIQTAPKETR